MNYGQKIDPQIVFAIIPQSQIIPLKFFTILAPQPEAATNETEPTNELIAPADLTDEEKAARRRAYIQFLGQLEDAKRQLPGLQGRWGVKNNIKLIKLILAIFSESNHRKFGPSCPTTIGNIEWR